MAKVFAKSSLFQESCFKDSVLCLNELITKNELDKSLPYFNFSGVIQVKSYLDMDDVIISKR